MLDGAPSDSFRDVQASFTKDQAPSLASISKGTKLAVRCRGRGLLMNVQLDRCEIDDNVDTRDDSQRPPSFRILARDGNQFALLVSSGQLAEDSVLWRIAKNLQKREQDDGRDGSLTAIFWIDPRFAPTTMPPTAAQLVQRKSTIVIDRRTKSEKLTRP